MGDKLMDIEGVGDTQQSTSFLYTNKEYGTKFNLTLTFEVLNGYWRCEPAFGTLFVVWGKSNENASIPDLYGSASTTWEASVQDLIWKIQMQLADGKKFKNFLDSPFANMLK